MTGVTELVGRSDELKVLREVLAGEPGGSGPRAALVLGEPGVGKTRLLSEATRLVTGCRTFHLVGFEPEQHVPLGAAAHLLHDLVNVGDEGRQLEAVLRAPDPALGGLEPLRVFEAAYRAVCRIGDVLIVIDDLQWIDDVSRALVHYLLRAAQADDKPLLLLCAARPTPPSTAFIGSVQRLLVDDDRCVELLLGPLTREAGVHLAQMLQPALPDDEAEHLWEKAAGSPFWIELAARSGPSGERSTVSIAGLLRSLSTEAATCLGALVVAARPAGADEVAEVLGWDLTRVEEAVAELVSRGIVSSHAGSFRTAHDLVREAALERIPQHELTRLHRRFCALLRGRAEGDLQLLMEALEHEHAAGTASVALALAIARSPQRRVLGPAGFARLATVAEAPHGDVAETMALKIELAHIADELGDHEAALERWGALSETLQGAGDRAGAAIKAARHAGALGLSSDVSALLDRARADGRDDPWTQVATDAIEHNRLVWLEHDAARAKPHLQAAIGAARSLRAQVGPIETLPEVARLAYAEAVNAECTARLMDDDIVGMLVVADEMVEATRGLGEPHLDARVSACTAQRFLNHWQDCETRLRAVASDARQQVFPGIAAFATYELALAAYNLGRVADARRIHEEARRLGERIDTVFEVSDTWLSALRHLIDASADDWAAATASLREEADRQANPHIRLALRQGAATCAARFGGPEYDALVADLLDTADADAITADCARCMWELRIVAAELFARVGRTSRANELLASWDAAHPTPQPRALYMRARAGAVVAAKVGSADAVELLREFREAAAAAGTGLDELWTLVDLGDVLALGDRTGAIDALRAAARLAAELGASSEAALVKRRLRALGVHGVASARAVANGSPLGGLTRRERDVACLAARGARNGDIAQTLFISPKTVEQHMSHIYLKLGVRNRVQLGSRYGAQLIAATGAATT